MGKYNDLDLSQWREYTDIETDSLSIDLSNPNKIAKALSEPLNVAWKTSNMSGSFKTELRYIYLYSVDWTKNY